MNSSFNLINNNYIVAACPTVFNKDQTVNYDETADILDFLEKIKIKSMALLIFGGEYYRLTMDEKKRIIEYLCSSTFRPGEIMVGINDNSLFAMKELSKVSDKYGVDYLIISPPQYVPFYQLNKKFVEKFVSKALEMLDIPVIFQDTNTPSSYLPDMEFWRKYIDSEKVAGFKIEGKGSVIKMRKIRNVYPDIMIYGGYLGLDIIRERKAGSDGSIIGSSMPDVVNRMMLNGDAADRDKISEFLKFEVNHLDRFVEIEKYVLKRRGIIDNYECREPCPHLSKILIDRLESLISILEL
ncbi:dihydrodipicolinate synthase family protein [Thermoplasma sp.]|uniref:dihydrodipicolinate synthase family protein n=1 Tax=Thermoplasma sp. TaxID=1973142 RepID=UPI002619B0C5|nr:dihydrodipicolinate synthase family protein [Thermoplasma sp.]